MSLFNSVDLKILPGTPWAEILRPQTLSEVVGQSRLLGELKKFVQQKYLPSLILNGPPGTGKTSIAQALCRELNYYFIQINAVESGAKELKQIGDSARQRRLELSQQTLLFVDEIHRFNKAQQDVLLGFIEKGDLILIGATTENPNYELNRALISRCRLYKLDRLSTSDITNLLLQALQKLKPLLSAPEFEKLSQISSSENLSSLIEWADGDARKVLLALEQIVRMDLQITDIKDILGQKSFDYDKNSDQHYDIISALIKSMRGSDPDAAVYWLCRMLIGGESLTFIARRLMVFASEDIGNADPRALSVAVSGAQAVEHIGPPEAEIILSQVVTYLASAPKSNRSYVALNKATEFIQKSGNKNVPPHLLSGSKKTNYKYPHDFPRSWVEQSYWPTDVAPQVFYEPGERGFEKNIRDYMQWLKQR